MEKEKLSIKITVIIMAVVFYGFAIMCYIKPSEKVSSVERRTLAQLPELRLDNISGGDFMEKFEEYAVDQIPFRQTFRTVRACYGYILLAQLDTNELYMCHGYISKLDYPLNEESLSRAAEKFGRVYNKYIKGMDMNVYLSIIPDKNYFNCNEVYLTYNYDEMVEKMCNSMEYAEYIDIMSGLERGDYYRTDTHWRQEELIDIAKLMGKSMGVDVRADYDILEATDNYHGVYYGQMAIPVKGETMYYLTNDILEGCQVYDHENDREISMYDLSAIEGEDPYEMYLYGPLSLITITNPDGNTDKELIIFRDSFGSSIAPLLVPGYSKITLVDIRYIQIEYLDNFIEFKNQDVLFLYSTSVLNNSETIK